jgi:general secretion pathway protein F
MERALELLIDAAEDRPTRSLLAGVRDRVREGAPPADALAGASHSVTRFEHAVLSAADEAASVAPALEGLAVFLEEQETLRERVRSALIYPALVFTVGVCVAIIMLGLLLPRTRELLEGAGGGMPGLTRACMAAGTFLLHWGWVLLLVPAGAVLYWRQRVRDDAERRVRWDRRLFRVPLWGRGYELLAGLRFARSLAMTLRGGVSLVDALPLAGRATGSRWIAALSDEESEFVRHGGRLSEALQRIPPLARSLPGWVRIGEAGGALPRMLDAAGDRYQERWERLASRSLALLEPALILAVGGFVLLVTSAVLLPVIRLSRGVGM